MNRSLIGWIVAAVLAFGGAMLAYVLFLAGGSAEPSTELTTPEIPGATSTIESDSTAETSSPATTVEGTADEVAYVIDSEQSTASFEINEVLRGQPTTVVGTTNQVAGQVFVDATDLGNSTFSELVINARTLTTDEERRDRAIRGPVILDSGSDEHEMISFTPTAVDGLDGQPASSGETYEFTIIGDLTIKGTTNPVTFDVSVEMVDESTIEGVATAEMLRSAFGIGIPSVPFVAGVSDEVTLSLDFVATTG